MYWETHSTKRGCPNYDPFDMDGEIDFQMLDKRLKVSKSQCLFL